MDLVDKNDIALFHLFKKVDHALRRKASGIVDLVKTRLHFVGENLCERRFAETVRTVQEHVRKGRIAQPRFGRRVRQNRDRLRLSVIIFQCLRAHRVADRIEGLRRLFLCAVRSGRRTRS